MSAAPNPQPARPRVGHITFLNCLPLYWGLQRTGALDLLELVRGTPDVLSDALVAGEVDAGLISVVEYLRHPEGLLLMPDLAVGSAGPVMSVNIVSARPLEELDGRPVALGATSRTSVLLARMLLEQRYGVQPVYSPHAPDLRAMMRVADAAVLIGDPALRASLSEAADLGLQVHDLGELWRDWTGLPMVFAVWGVREEWFARAPEQVREVMAAFLASRDLAAARYEEIATEAARWEPFDAADLARYFKTLDFRLGGPQLAGLREFAARVAPLAGSASDPEIRVVH
jgi:chorismate dehydratase